ncbi:hypothetical protein GA0070616_4355 [Micromonospora nigra]|uniref:Uncharacterized protein n=1 Tax=Micromonospora nigra TaxID=145857 RepID=A0A1C6SRG7_9ACTN|nr:hypothetical protein [Micromonospora nigra]SCL31909.1 hypothetical protein GA0070616_4355 [Micromonospora nigra]
MGVIGDNAVSSGDIMRRLRELEKQVEQLNAARRLESASIGRGGLVIKDGGALRVVDEDGRSIAWFGLNADTGQRGVVLRRAGGALAFAAYGTGEGGDTGFVALYDLAGQYIVTDDVASGRGLARPYIPVPMGEVAVPTATTTSSTFVDLASGLWPVQHPALHAYLLVRADDGSTTGEVRLTLDGVQVGDVLSVTAGQYTYATIGPAPTPGIYPFGSLRTLAMQARRTAGSGSIGVRVLTVVGVESALAV